MKSIVNDFFDYFDKYAWSVSQDDRIEYGNEIKDQLLAEYIWGGFNG